MNKMLYSLLILFSAISFTQAGEVDNDWLYSEYGTIVETLSDKSADADEVIAGFIELWNKNDRSLQSDLALYTMQAIALRPAEMMTAFAADESAFRNLLDGLETLSDVEQCGEGVVSVQRYAEKMNTELQNLNGVENKTFSALANDLEEAIAKLRPHGMR
ncbi:MAG: hypothetical protein AAFP70_03440 [Calditrichota bacterium]